MNLLSKTLILLIFFNGIEYSLEGDLGECPLTGPSLKCCWDKFGMAFLGSILPDQTGAPDKNKGCCFRYYLHCIGFFATRKHCPNVDLTAAAKDAFKNMTRDCSPFPTKDLCSKYHKDVEQECKQYSYSECENYSWSPDGVSPPAVPQKPKPQEPKPQEPKPSAKPPKSNDKPKETPKAPESLAPISVNPSAILWLLSVSFFFLK